MATHRLTRYKRTWPIPIIVLQILKSLHIVVQHRSGSGQPHYKANSWQEACTSLTHQHTGLRSRYS
jgi:hypothetical protein